MVRRFSEIESDKSPRIESEKPEKKTGSRRRKVQDNQNERGRGKGTVIMTLLLVPQSELQEERKKSKEGT